MKYLSICSGIEAATVAWKPLGWQAAWYAEIDPFPCAVLAHLDKTESVVDLLAAGFQVKQTKTGKHRVNDTDRTRYKALGNSMAVPVMRWIGERMARVHNFAR